ncbi:MAG: HlyD family secretion protein [Acidobacteriota bacterium]|nr:HlyD family secretion protein [Acidobacteriota bacterium]
MANEEQNTPAPAESKAGLMERKPWLAVALRVLVVVGLIGAVAFWWYSRKYEDTDDAQIDGYIYPISTRISGHIVKVNVEDGQFVKAGTVLAEIDDTDYQVAVVQANAAYLDATASSEAANFGVPISEVGSRAQINSAQADVINAQAGIASADKQVDEARARLIQAEANAKTANLDLARYGQLVGKKEISQQQYDQASAASTSANAQVDAARAAVHSAQEIAKQARARLSQAHAGLENAQVTPKNVALTAARARATEATAGRYKAQLDQAQLNLSYTKVIAPVDGVVGNRNAQVGQNVQPGQELLSLVPLKNIWVTANFKETQLEFMRPGQEVTIKADALGGQKFKGRVTSIGGATGARFSLLPPENATGNYVKVVQRIPVRIDFEGIDKPDFNQDGRLRPGLSVEPDVRVR